MNKILSFLCSVLLALTALMAVGIALLFNGDAVSLHTAVTIMPICYLSFFAILYLKIKLHEKSTQELQLNGRIGK